MIHVHRPVADQIVPATDPQRWLFPFLSITPFACRDDVRSSGLTDGGGVVGTAALSALDAAAAARVGDTLTAIQLYPATPCVRVAERPADPIPLSAWSLRGGGRCAPRLGGPLE